MSRVLLSAPALAEALDGPQPPVVLDARWSLTDRWQHEAYLDAHVPGAVWVDAERALSAPGPRDGSGRSPGGRHPLPTVGVFAKAMRRAGVDTTRRVVCMDGGDGLAAARLWWMLRAVGHDDVRILDGGLAAWRRSGGPVRSGEDVAARAGLFVPVVTTFAGAVDAEDVAGALAEGSAAVFDVRAPERHRGEVEPIDVVAGAIPGARNLPDAALHGDDGAYLPAAALRTVLRPVSDGDIVHCGSGFTAARTAAALAEVGREVRLYVGSWSDWISDPSRPVHRT